MAVFFNNPKEEKSAYRIAFRAPIEEIVLNGRKTLRDLKEERLTEDNCSDVQFSM